MEAKDSVQQKALDDARLRYAIVMLEPFPTQELQDQVIWAFETLIERLAREVVHGTDAPAL